MINQFFDSLSCAVTRTGPEAAIGQRALSPPTNAVCFGSAITFPRNQNWLKKTEREYL